MLRVAATKPKADPPSDGQHAKALGIMDTFAVKQQTLKTAVEAAAMLLRIDDIISGISKKKRGDGPQQPAHDQDETFGDARDG